MIESETEANHRGCDRDSHDANFMSGQQIKNWQTLHKY